MLTTVIFAECTLQTCVPFFIYISYLLLLKLQLKIDDFLFGFKVAAENRLCISLLPFSLVVGQIVKCRNQKLKVRSVSWLVVLKLKVDSSSRKDKS